MAGPTPEPPQPGRHRGGPSGTRPPGERPPRHRQRRGAALPVDAGAVGDRPRHASGRQPWAGTLVSAAGLRGRPVVAEDGERVGRLVDVVVRWDRGVYPEMAGLIVRVGLRTAFVPAADVGTLDVDRIVLRSTRLDLRDFERRPGEWLVLRDLLDHQLLDVDGARVVRAADLYLAPMGGGHGLVGVDVSFTSFLRRVLPGRAGRAATPARVIDWSTVQAFGRPGDPVRLRRPHRGLERLRAADLAALVADLGRRERHVLLDLLDPGTAAAVLEEMDADHIVDVLRHAPDDKAADLLGRMEPDEAADALRGLPDAERAALLAAMPDAAAADAQTLLGYDADVAGGIMTTSIVTLHLGDTIAQARQAALARSDPDHVQCLVVVDDEGRLVDDLPLLDLMRARPEQRVADVISPPVPSTVAPEADLDEVVRQLAANRRQSLLVVDPAGRPLGRILADDIIDALVTGRGSRRWPWQRRRSAT